LVGFNYINLALELNHSRLSWVRIPSRLCAVTRLFELDRQS